MLTANELAERLGLVPDTVRAWARAGRLPCVRLGARTIRFDPEEVNRAMSEIAGRDAEGVAHA